MHHLTKSPALLVMDPLLLLALFLPCLPLLHFLHQWRWSKRLPPGSMGLPLIGESLSILKALWDNKAEEWIASRVEKYGPICKSHVFGSPTVLIAGPAGNKFVFTSDALSGQQPTSLRRTLGERNMKEVEGKEHRRIRGAVSQFMGPEALKLNVGRIDKEVRDHLARDWTGHHNVVVLPLVKRMTFNIICGLVFGIEEGPLRDDRLLPNFKDILNGILAIPVNMPFTSFNRSLRANRRITKLLAGIVKDRKASFKQGNCQSRGDLISYMISLGSLSDEEIVDNALFVMIAGHDTSAVLITFMIRQLAKDPAILAEMVQEQEEIAKGKAPGEPLTWEDLSKMKYTWRVALETLRLVPPVFAAFRTAIRDIEFNGYLIPKGWKVVWATCMTHRDSDLFPDAEKFDPRRYENQSSIPPYSYVAFGGGPRVCPGGELSRIETLVMMHYLVTRFRWKLCGEDGYRRNPMPFPLKGLPIEIEART